MNRSPIILESSPTLNLHSEPLALRLPVGAAVFALKGTVWLTQERLRDDIILTPGERFNVNSEALILASGVTGNAVIHIVQPAAARAHVQPDIYDFARAQAERLRRDEILRLANRAGAAFSAWVARAGSALRMRPSAFNH